MSSTSSPSLTFGEGSPYAYYSGQANAALNQWSVVTIAFIALELAASVACGLRLWSIALVGGFPKRMDWLILVSWLTMTMSFGCTLAMSGNMQAFLLGQQTESGGLDNYIKFNSFAYVLCAALVKLYFGLFIHSFTEQAAPRMLIYFIMGAIFVSSIVSGFFQLITCGPSASFFGDSYTCSLWLPYGYITSVWSLLDIVSGLGLLILSINALCHARVTEHAWRLSLIVMLLGFLSLVASIVRIAILCASDMELSYIQSMNVGVCGSVEMGLGVIAASVSRIRPVLDKIAPRVSSWRVRRARGSNAEDGTELNGVDNRTSASAHGPVEVVPEPSSPTTLERLQTKDTSTTVSRSVSADQQA